MKRLAALLFLTLLLPAASAQQLRPRILETTDVHMKLLSLDGDQSKAVEDHGLERTTTLIASARAEARSSLLFLRRALTGSAFPRLDACIVEDEGNRGILPVVGVKLRSTSGAGGIAHLSQVLQVALVEHNGDGAALHELAP